MATNTTNLSLIKPAGTDKVRIAQINQNMDIIDAAIGAVGSTSLQSQVAAVDSGLAIVSNGNTHVAITSGQYVYIRNHSSLSEGLYKATAAIAANVALTTSNVTKLTTGSANDLKGAIENVDDKILNMNQSRVWSTSSYTLESFQEEIETIIGESKGFMYLGFVQNQTAGATGAPFAGHLVALIRQTSSAKQIRLALFQYNGPDIATLYRNSDGWQGGWSRIENYSIGESVKFQQVFVGKATNAKDGYFGSIILPRNIPSGATATLRAGFTNYGVWYSDGASHTIDNSAAIPSTQASGNTIWFSIPASNIADAKTLAWLRLDGWIDFT